jgi:hypothetical protein
VSSPEFSADFEKRWFKDSARPDEPQKCWICGESFPWSKMASHWTAAHIEAAMELDRTMQGTRRRVMKLLFVLLLLPVAVLAIYLLSLTDLSPGQLLVLGSSAVGILIIVIIYNANVIPARVLEKHRQIWSQGHPGQMPEKRK